MADSDNGGDDALLITLLTEDGQRVPVERRVAQQMGVLRGALTVSRDASVIPVPGVKSTILAKVVEFLLQHSEDPPAVKPKVYLQRRTPKINEDGDDENEYDSEGELEVSSDEIDDECLYEDYLANVTPWDQKFLDALDMATLIELTKAANYLNTPLLLDLCCRTIAKQMSGLTAEELRKKFNIPNDFTPEEEAKMAAEFAWIDE